MGLGSSGAVALKAICELGTVALSGIGSLLSGCRTSGALVSGGGPCMVIVSRFGEKGISGVFNRLVALLRPSGEGKVEGTRDMLLPCSGGRFCVPSGIFLITAVGATSESLSAVSCTVEEEFTFVAMGPRRVSSSGFGSRLFHRMDDLFVDGCSRCTRDKFSSAVGLLPTRALSRRCEPRSI